MKKKKLLLLTATFSAACALGLTACDNESEAHTHTYGEWTIVQESTCTEKGLKESVCIDGDSTMQEEIAALGHDYQEFVTSPTCTEQGYTTYICVRCGDTYVDNFVPALGHEYGEDGWCIRGDDRYSVGLSYELSSSGTAYTVIGIGTCTDTEVIIPSTYEGLPVTAIGERAFENNTAIASIVLSSNIESIGIGAFRNCTNLANASLGEKQAEETASVQKTSYRTARSRIVTPLAATESVGELLNGIGAYAFEGCENLTSVAIGSGFTSIGSGAFFSCGSLAEIKVGSNLTEIGELAFKGTAYVQASLQENGDVAYLISEDGTTKYLLEASAGISGGYGVQANTTIIAAGAFAACESLTEIILPEGVKAIGDNAFSGCSSLTSVEIPKTVITVGENVFVECSALAEIYYGGSEEDFAAIQLEVEVTVHFNAPSSEEGQTHEHIYQAVTLAEPTCTEYGSVKYTCTECGSYYYENVAPLGHEWGEWKVTTPATCTAKGVETRVCLHDGSHTETREIPARGHNYVATVTPPTCTSQGYTTHTCSRCGASYKDNYTAALGHEWGEWKVTTPATYDTAGVETRVCLHDGSHTETREIPAIGHDYDTEAIVWTWNQDHTSATAAIPCRTDEAHTAVLDATVTSEITKEATCEESGLITYTASVTFNGETFTNVTTETIAATGHSYDDGEVTTQPTCTEAGVITYTCTVCGDSYTETIPALGHDYEAAWTWNTDYTSATATFTCKNDASHTQTLEATVTSEITRELTATAPGIRTYTATIEFEGSIYTATVTEEIGTEGLAYALNEDGASYSVTGIGTATDTAIVIPSTYEGLPVTSIDSYAFNMNKTITSVVIPDSVTSIGDWAFYGCSGLTGDLVIPDSVTSIGSEGFSGCSGLTGVTIGNNVTSIGSYAFTGTSFYNNSDNWVDNVLYLTATDGKTLYLIEADFSISGAYEIVEGTKLIAAIAFRSCSGLTSIVIPDSVTSIGTSAFSGCSGLTSVTIGNGVTSIGGSAFSECSGLTSIVIPDSVTSIDEYAFWICSGLTSIVIPDSVTSIGDRAFSNCSGLTSITVGEGNENYYSEGNCIIEKATNTLILGCQNSVIPDSVTSIGSSAFSGCSGLTGVTIGNNVTSIGSYAFEGCSGLMSITVSEGNEYYYSEGNCIIEKATNTLILGCQNSVIPDDVTSIGSYAFQGCSGLTGELVIPDGVTSIGSYAFSWCSGLTGELVIPDSVTSIGNLAFSGCSGLTSVVIPDSVTSIGDMAFFYCNGLTGELVIPDSVTSIGSYAFYGCSGLTGELVIPDSMTSIGSYAFYGCSGLTSIVIADGVTSIDYGVFSGCSGLTSVVIPDSVTSIGSWAFDGCGELTDIYYTGTEEEWNAIDKSNAEIPSTATIHYEWSES